MYNTNSSITCVVPLVWSSVYTACRCHGAVACLTTPCRWFVKWWAHVCSHLRRTCLSVYLSTWRLKTIFFFQSLSWNRSVTLIYYSIHLLLYTLFSNTKLLKSVCCWNFLAAPLCIHPKSNRPIILNSVKMFSTISEGKNAQKVSLVINLRYLDISHFVSFHQGISNLLIIRNFLAAEFLTE